MIRLIKSELKKIFCKKSFYIVTILFILYAILTNVIYKEMNIYDINNERLDITEAENANRNLDLNNPDDLLLYVSNLTTIEIGKIDINSKTSNQIYLNHNYLYPVVEKLNESKYISKDEEKAKELEKEKNDIMAKISADDYKYFVNKNIEELKEKINTTTCDETKERLNVRIKLAEYRLKNNISFDSNNHLNNAIIDIETDLVEYRNLKAKKNLTTDEKERLQNLDSMFLKNKYILEEQKDINNTSTVRYILSNFNSEFQIFILIYIVMICGSIVSEEFNKGTIKYLLTKPFKRRTILTSKLLTILILIPLIIFFMILIEIIIGGIILGFDSLSIPILIYNASKGVLVKYSCFGYLFISLIACAPIYIVLSILCFGLSTITISTSAAITITFLFYLVSEVIRNLALIYNLSILKAFVSIHWDFSYLINYYNNPFKFSPIHSFLIVLGYISVILCLTYLYFSKKDVKNI